jgi:hypothetical protein
MKLSRALRHLLAHRFSHASSRTAQIFYSHRRNIIYSLSPTI